MPPIDQAATEPDTLRSDIEALMDAPETGGEIVSGDQHVDAAPDTPDVVDAKPDTETPAEREQRQRGDKGRFAPKTEAAPDKAAPVNTEIPAKDVPAKASETAASTPQDAPPAGWPADAKAEWSKLSPALKAAVVKRETEIANGGRQWSEEKRHYQGMLAPVAEEAARLGMPVDQALNALMAAHHSLSRNAPNAIRQLCQTYGVDPSTLAGRQQPADGSQPEQVQPDIAAVVRSEIAKEIGPIRQRFASEDQRQSHAAQSTVEDFAAAPGHEHFSAVSDDIIAILPSVKAANPRWSQQQVLQESYDRAVYANPATRQAILDDRDRKAVEQRTAEAKLKTANARRAAVSVTGSPSGVPQVQGKDSLRAEIEAAYAGG